MGRLQELGVSLGVVIAAFSLGSLMCPRVKEKSVEVPKIVTRYDTVTEEPKWLRDSIKVWHKKVYTTDTLRLTLTETVIDTEYVPVNAPPELRPDLWPVLELHAGRSANPSYTIRSFNTRTGAGGVSTVYPVGYIVDLEVGASPSPRIIFAPFPPAEKHGFWHNPKVFGIGLGSGAIVCALLCR